MERYELVVTPKGTLQFVYADALRPLNTVGAAQIARASHVEPTGTGQWTADMRPVDGPLLGPFETRAAALAAEVAWLTPRLGALTIQPDGPAGTLPHQT